MLRKHLERLEQPVDGEERLETAYELKSEEERESDHAVEGAFLFPFVLFMLLYH